MPHIPHESDWFKFPLFCFPIQITNVCLGKQQVNYLSLCPLRGRWSSRFLVSIWPTPGSWRHSERTKGGRDMYMSVCLYNKMKRNKIKGSTLVYKANTPSLALTSHWTLVHILTVSLPIQISEPLGEIGKKLLAPSFASLFIFTFERQIL